MNILVITYLTVGVIFMVMSTVDMRKNDNSQNPKDWIKCLTIGLCITVFWPVICILGLLIPDKENKEENK